MNKNGFSLIEILIAISLSAIIFPAVIQLMSLSTFTTSQGETYTEAYTIAQKEMENIYSLKKTNWDDSKLVAGPEFCQPPTDGYTVCQTNTDISTKEKNIIIKVIWNERGIPQNVSIESIIANI